MVLDSRLITVSYTSDFTPVSSSGMLKIETTKDYGFNLNFARDMTKTYSQIHCKDKYSYLSLIISCLWSNG